MGFYRSVVVADMWRFLSSNVSAGDKRITQTRASQCAPKLFRSFESSRQEIPGVYFRSAELACHLFFFFKKPEMGLATDTTPYAPPLLGMSILKHLRLPVSQQLAQPTLVPSGSIDKSRMGASSTRSWFRRVPPPTTKRLRRGP